MARIGRQLRRAAARQHGRRRAHADPAQGSGWRSSATRSRSSRRPASSRPPRLWSSVYGVLKEKGSSDTLGAELYSFDKFCRLVGFEHVWEFEKRWPETDAGA